MTAASVDILEEFAKEQRLAEEREDLENDILQDFEELKAGGEDPPPDETCLQEVSFRSTAVYQDLILQMNEESSLQ